MDEWFNSYVRCEVGLKLQTVKRISSIQQSKQLSKQRSGYLMTI